MCGNYPPSSQRNFGDAASFDVLDKDIDKKRGLGVIISSSPNKVSLRENLSPTRANGLASMIATIRETALRQL